MVIEVVTTDPTFGQEPIPGWPNNSPVKDAPGYALYDLQIARDATEVPTGVNLYKFPGANYTSDANFSKYLLASSAVSTPSSSSAQVLAALESDIDLILSREHPTRLVINFAGHGSPSVFFEAAITNADSQTFLSYVRQKIGFTPIILDFSTNCNDGYLEFVERYAGTANYLIATEKPFGGYSIDNSTIDQWLAVRHDTILDQFWSTTNSTDQALDAMMVAQQSVWKLEIAGLQSAPAVDQEQSIATYDLSKFDTLVQTLATDTKATGAAITAASNDIGTFILASGDADLIAKFQAFRPRYVSDRAEVTWTDNSQGFSRAGNIDLPTVLAPLLPAASPLVAAVLPASRSIAVGGTATAFATIINGGTATLNSCSIIGQNKAPLPLSLSYQTTDSATNLATGAVDAPVTLAPGQAQSFVISLTSSDVIAPSDVSFNFICAGTGTASPISGVNTLLLSASSTPVPDIVALAATTTGDGTAHIPGTAGAAAFAVATVNLGASSAITASVDTGSASLPLTLSVCQTDPVTGQCISAIAPTVTATVTANTTPTFALFLQATGSVPFSPGTNRIFVRFKGADGVVRGATSVAVRTN